MATTEEAIELLIDNWQTADFTSARITFGDNAAIARGKVRIREMEYALILAASQGVTADDFKSKLKTALTAFKASLQEALDASASPLVTSQISTAMSQADTLISAIDAAPSFASASPSFSECLP